MPVSRYVRSILCVVIVLFVARMASAQPMFETQGETFDITAAGVFTSDVSVLANDSVNPADSLVAELVSPPSQGTLVFRADGTFDYDPAGAAGMQVFTYRAATLPTQLLQIVPEESVLTFDAELDPESLGPQHDQEDVVFEGEVLADLGPTGSLQGDMQILGMAASNRDDVGLRFDYGALGAFIVDTVPGGLRLGLGDVGAPVTPTGESSTFIQTGNRLSLEVDAQVSGEGFIGDQVPEGTEYLATEFDFDIVGTVVVDPSIVLEFDVGTYNEFDLDGDTIRVETIGSFRATGEPVARTYSDPVEVKLNVADHTALEDDEVPGDARLAAIYPNPATKQATILLSGQPGRERTAEVVDVLGRTVRSVPVTDSRVSVDVTDLAAGVYLVRLSDAPTRSLTLIVR